MFLIYIVLNKKKINTAQEERERRKTNRKKTKKRKIHFPVINENKSPAFVTLKHPLLPHTSKDHEHNNKQKTYKTLRSISPFDPPGYWLLEEAFR